VRIFAGEATPAGRTSGAAVRAIAQEQVTAAAPAKLAVATGREQRIVVGRARSVAERIAAELEVAAEQANSAVVVEQIEAALEAAAAPFKGSAAGEVRQGARVSEVARAGRAAAVVEVAAAAVVEDLAAAVEVAGGDALANRVPDRRSCSPWWSSPRHPTLDTRISFDGGRNEISKQRNENVQAARTSRNRVRNIFDDLRPRRYLSRSGGGAAKDFFLC